ncbi:hypothetical protein VIGAN_03223800, partial [Vigna angularis var. angularis]
TIDVVFEAEQWNDRMAERDWCLETTNTTLVNGDGSVNSTNFVNNRFCSCACECEHFLSKVLCQAKNEVLIFETSK